MSNLRSIGSVNNLETAFQKNVGAPPLAIVNQPDFSVLVVPSRVTAAHNECLSLLRGEPAVWPPISTIMPRQYVLFSIAVILLFTTIVLFIVSTPTSSNSTSSPPMIDPEDYELPISVLLVASALFGFLAMLDYRHKLINHCTGLNLRRELGRATMSFGGALVGTAEGAEE